MKTVFWDFDGTLGRREGGWSGTLFEVLKMEFPGTEVTLEQLRGRMDYPWHHPEIPHQELAKPDDWWGAMMPEFFSAFRGAGLGEGMAARLAGKFRERYLAEDRWSLFDDALPALRELAGRGWKQAIITNHVPEFRMILGRLGIAEYFADILNSAETGYEKPNPRMYEIALERLGNPSPAWMIGDNVEADYFGAECAGLTPLLVRSPDPRASRFSADLVGAVALLAQGAVAG